MRLEYSDFAIFVARRLPPVACACRPQPSTEFTYEATRAKSTCVARSRRDARRAIRPLSGGYVVSITQGRSIRGCLLSAVQHLPCRDPALCHVCKKHTKRHRRAVAARSDRRASRRMRTLGWFGVCRVVCRCGRWRAAAGPGGGRSTSSVRNPGLANSSVISLYSEQWVSVTTSGGHTDPWVDADIDERWPSIICKWRIYA